MIDHDEKKAKVNLGKAISRITPHDEIVRPIEMGKKRSKLYLAMELLAIVVASSAAALLLIPFIAKYF